MRRDHSRVRPRPRARALPVAALLLAVITALLALLAPRSASMIYALPYLLPMIVLMEAGNTWAVVATGLVAALLLSYFVFPPRFELATSAEALLTSGTVAALGAALGLISAAT